MYFQFAVMETTKVFWSGSSQAVRLPQAFRVDVRQVRIQKRGQQIILEPIEESWGWLDRLAGSLDADAAVAAEEQVMAQRRPALDTLFK